MGQYNGEITCLPSISTLCSDRDKHVFWDAFHPTEAANRLIARAAFDGNTSEIVPMNLRQLLQQG